LPPLTYNLNVITSGRHSTFGLDFVEDRHSTEDLGFVENRIPLEVSHSI
jgi:hypothetical protein